jgi:hypothetical protein
VELFNGVPLEIVSQVAANILHSIRLRWSDKVQQAYDEMISATERISTICSSSVKARYSIAANTKAPSRDLAYLVGYVIGWPLRWNRYEPIRSTTSKEHPLCGHHREIWQESDAEMKRRVANLTLVENVPDYEGCVATRQEYAKEFIVQPRDPNFLRKKTQSFAARFC